MRIAFVADPHQGNHKKNGGPVVASVNRRGRDSLAALEAAVAEAGDCAAFVVLGDLFDYTRPEPQITAGVQRAFAPIRDTTRIVFLVGNHDQHSTAPGDHACAPLEIIGDIVDVDVTCITVGPFELVVCPFKPGNASEWLPAMLKDLPPKPSHVAHRVLCVHLGIADDETPYFLDGSEDAVSVDEVEVLACKHDFDFVCAGNWHRREMWSFDRPSGETTCILQVGTLAPNRFTDCIDDPEEQDAGFGTVMFLDTDASGFDESFPMVDFVEVPGPRFVKTVGIEGLRDFARDYLQTTEWRQRMGAAPLYVSVEVVPDDYTTAVTMCKELPDGVHGDIKIDRSAIAKATREAVSEAAKAVTVDGAVAAYMETYPIPEGVSRSAAKQRVGRYLIQAQSM